MIAAEHGDIALLQPGNDGGVEARVLAVSAPNPRAELLPVRPDACADEQRVAGRDLDPRKLGLPRPFGHG